MDVLLLSTYDWGGSGTATKRIHQGLRNIGVDSRMLVQHKRGDDPTIIGPRSRLGAAYGMARIVSDSWPLKPFGGADRPISLNWLPDRLDRKVDELDPELLHLNWIGEGFFSPATLADFDVPIVWRFPDMWPMTGGCHYSKGCDRFTDSCGSCPALKRPASHDPTWWTHRKKRHALEKTDVTVVAPCSWLAEQAERSALFGTARIETIPNGLDISVFEPADVKRARDAFDLPLDRKVLLFGSIGPTSDPRKGFDLLHPAVRRVAEEWGDDRVEVVVFGAEEPPDPPDFGFDTRYVGYIDDPESLALLYAGADVMVVPSTYEGFGQTVTEAQACGTPVVAFNASGPRDTVEHRTTGYLAEPYEPDDLAAGISWALEGDRPETLGEHARARACEKYDLETVAREYRELYLELVEDR